MSCSIIFVPFIKVVIHVIQKRISKAGISFKFFNTVVIIIKYDEPLLTRMLVF